MTSSLHLHYAAELQNVLTQETSNDLLASSGPLAATKSLKEEKSALEAQATTE